MFVMGKCVVQSVFFVILFFFNICFFVLAFRDLRSVFGGKRERASSRKEHRKHVPKKAARNQLSSGFGYSGPHSRQTSPTERGPQRDKKRDKQRDKQRDGEEEEE